MLLDRRHHHTRATRKIDSRGCDLWVSHHLGKSIYITTPFKHQCCEGVAKRMGREINLGLFFYLHDKIIYAGDSDPTVELGGSEEKFRSFRESFSFSQVVHQIARQACWDRHYTIFSSFPAHDRYAHLFDIYILRMQVCNFLLPKTRKDHESEDGYIPFLLISIRIFKSLYALYYQLGILSRETLRKGLLKLRLLDRDHRVLWNLSSLE